MTLHDPSKLDVLQDRLEDLPPPVVVRGVCVQAWERETGTPAQAGAQAHKHRQCR